jgi:hypothetical protein
LFCRSVLPVADRPTISFIKKDRERKERRIKRKRERERLIITIFSCNDFSFQLKCCYCREKWSVFVPLALPKK